MGKTVLRISKTKGASSLPLSYVTGTAAILGQKRSGKSYKASVLAEELLDAGQQIVVLDPTSAWWGLRSSLDGKSAGYPITIIGGEHGDLPLDPAAGAELARAIVHERFSAIIDLDGMTKGEEQRFCAPFLDTLYREKKGAYRTPLHLFLDEADVYAPQRPMGDETRTLGACQSIVRRGGIKGIGITMITQRPAELSKGVLSQVDTLITLRLMHPTDMAQIDAWVAVHGDRHLAKQMMADLPDLPRGEAYVWSPMHGLFERVTFRDRQTFDSGKTPDTGGQVAPPKVLAKVDIEKLGAAIATSAAEAKASDPKVLRARIVELERELAKKPSAEPRVIETPAIDKKHVDAVEKVADRLDGHVDRVVESIAELRKICDDGLHNVAYNLHQDVATWLRGASGSPNAGRSRSVTTTVSETPSKPPRREPGVTARRDGASTVKFDEVYDKGNALSTPDGSFTRAHLQILGALAWWREVGQDEPSTIQVAIVAGYTDNGHFRNLKGHLSSAGMIEYPRNGTIRITDKGLKLIDDFDLIIPLSLAGLHAAAIARCDNTEQKILDVALTSYPRVLKTVELATNAGYTDNGHFRNLKGHLSSKKLIEYPRNGEVRAASWLFPEGLS